MKAVVLAIGAYCLVAIFAFGDVLAPIAFMTFWSDRLAIPSWRLLVLASAGVSLIVFLFPKRFPLSLSYRLPAFVAITMVLSVVSVGYFANNVRKEELSKFHPDEYVDHSFFESIRVAPREYQFYLHTAALKNCVLYGWSYRTLSFYKVPPDAHVDVGRKWISRCSADRL
jgi:hypothetical protein